MSKGEINHFTVISPVSENQLSRDLHISGLVSPLFDTIVMLETAVSFK
jgi:hypothetical protein